ncbi:MAG: META domain-containing protein [Dysgonamonadaceae bacterium]|jgi:heat shock protein HslJ|nr:META domain-containing protein [Dysgonamonadaceae bacterium]
MKNIFLLLGIVALATGIVSCGAKKSTVVDGESVAKNELLNAGKDVAGKYWKLVEIFGNTSITNPKEAYITFSVTDNKVFGNNGCNSFHGTYEIGADNKLKFSGIASTRMFCMNTSTESEMSKTFSSTDNYEVSADTLFLKEGEKIIARFVLSSAPAADATK